MDLEVEVRKPAVGVTALAEESEHVTCLHVLALDGEG